MSHRIMSLQTPARVYAVTQTETAFGGRSYSLSLSGTVWGDFQPEAPRSESGGEEDAYVVQAAQFLCRRIEVVPGSRLRIKGFDWTVLSRDEDAEGQVRLRMERVHL